MKRIALGLLIGAALSYGGAQWAGRAHPHPGWGYLAAFAEAAMVGAIADWFAVVALLRHPLGLPIPHTAIIPANKSRIGRNLARFICDNFLATPQVLARLAAFDPARRLRAELLAHPALGACLHGLWDQLRDWLDADLAQEDSSVRRRVGVLAAALGERLAADAPMQRWINAQILAAAPVAIARYREDIRRCIVERVARWDSAELTAEVERSVGRDLQFIRVNGTVVGGLAGLAIHAVTRWASGA